MERSMDLRFSLERWDLIKKNAQTWWEGELNRPLVWLSATDRGVTRPYSYMSNYPLEMPVEQVIERYLTVLERTNFYADGFPWLWVNFGPGILAGFLGARVNSVTQPSETVWFSSEDVNPIHEIDFKYDPQNVWWQRVKEITQALVQRYGPDLAVSHTDLGGNLDVLASFRETQNLLMDVLDTPEEVKRLAEQVTRLWLRYYDELDAIIRPACAGTSCWTPIWSPGKTYMLQCDFSYMISPAMFERFVLPDLTQCCDHLDHGFYHLDGKGQIPHLDLLLSIRRLRGIQWIPGDGQPTPDQWLPLLKRIRDGGKLCQVFVRPAGALRIVRNLGGRGFLLVIQPERDELENPEQIQAFLDTLARDDATASKTGYFA
jgi:5-methyltetrahydrofolate--homocysteine methyltransferase